MGPIIIFDKSALESLNADEAMWLDQFFNANITPLFFVETLADLEKEVRAGRTPEAVVGSLAYRTPDLSSRPNAHHLALLEAELLGGVTLDLKYGRPNLLNAKSVELDGKTGVILRQTPEEEALSRWRQGDFLDIERQQARRWRNGLAAIDLSVVHAEYKRFFPLGRPSSLASVKQLAEANLDSVEPGVALAFGLSAIGILPEYQRRVLDKWREAGKPPMRTFAPYLHYVTIVDLFFHIALAADLIGRERSSNAVDIAYLYYLPYCMVFTSNDRLHSRVVPLFLRENQSFIRGSDLKADLGKLDQHFDRLPPEVKARGVMSFAPKPPLDKDFLVTQLWDKHMSPSWRDERPPIDPNSESSRRISEEIKRFVETAREMKHSPAGETARPDHMIVQRMVRKHMGKWKRIELDGSGAAEEA